MDAASPSFEEFVDKHVGELLRTACLITWDDAEAEDLVQECLLRLANRWPQVRAMEMPAAYARRIVVNLAIDGRNRRSRRRMELSARSSDGYELDPVDLNAEAVFAGLGDRDELLDALAQLSPQQRAVLALRYFDDLSEQEVADVLRCSVGTVKSSASRGLARLREIVTQPFSPTEVCEP